MKRSITPWPTAIAAAALLALPAAGWAQTGTTGQQPPTTTTAEAQERETRDGDAAKEHLREARAALDGIENEALSGESRQKVAELKRHFASLERSVGANDRASATGAAQRSERATEARGSENWKTEVAAIDRILNNLIGPDQGAAGAVGTSGTTSTTGATGSTGAARATVTLDASSREALENVRKHVTKFAAKMGETGASPRHDDAAASTAAATATGTSATAATTQSGQTGTTDTTAAQAAAEGQVDAQAARRLLTEARETLSELTQLPQAAQLSGDARTQVSQLIANFNELITTQENWRASYTKVEANLDALLGPDAMTTAGTAGTTGTGSAGTVGTTGAATGGEMDPEVRSKLVELRTKLTEFERAAGGGAADASSTSPATTGTTAATATAAQQTTAQAQTQGAQTGHAGHMDQAEILSHIEAIETILNANDPMTATAGAAGTAGVTGAAGTSGSQVTGAAQPPSGAASSMAGEAITLSRAQVEQLRLHLNQLRGLVQR